MNKIFVNICSYRDKFLASTLENLLETESGRNHITYGIFEQTRLEDSIATKFPNLANHPRVKYKRIDPEYSEGVVWARAINSLQIDDEEFQYQIDSHMLFDDAWDHYLILDYLQASKLSNTDKIILTAGTKNYKLMGEDSIIKHTIEGGDITTSINYSQFPKTLKLTAHGHWIPATKSVKPSVHILAGNFFTTTKWLKDVGYNTKIFFSGEEQVLALSSWLAGYKIYNQRIVKVYHFMESNKHETKMQINPVVSNDKIERLEKRSQEELIRYIYSIDEDTLKRYSIETGVDYINRKLEPRIISKYLKPDPNLKNDWEAFNQIEENK